jgi:hypothetical protein
LNSDHILYFFSKSEKSSPWCRILGVVPVIGPSTLLVIGNILSPRLSRKKGKRKGKVLLWLMKRESRGIHKYECRCNERLKDETAKFKSLGHTRWNWGMGYLRRGGEGRGWEVRGLRVSEVCV